MKLEFLNFNKAAQGFACLMMLFALVACNKTKDFENLALLTGKDWNLESRKINGIEVSDSCDLDDVLRFTSASKFTFDWGAIACDDDGLIESADSWKLIENFSEIRMKFKFEGDGWKFGTYIEYWEIIELSDTMLVIKDANAESNDMEPEFRTYR